MLLSVGTDPVLPALDLPRTRIAAHHAYGTGVYLIRPDGHVGWAGGSAEGLAGYARRVGLAERVGGETAGARMAGSSGTG
ncbi:hypothetical protein [Streptomyces sp. enrichment culture]|uniref:hypothetical protein n=1 Tax=Streptomyces sp. enrichment culture TaxID=1795815 RepID=UPI003F57908F